MFSNLLLFLIFIHAWFQLANVSDIVCAGICPNQKCASVVHSSRARSCQLGLGWPDANQEQLNTVTAEKNQASEMQPDSSCIRPVDLEWSRDVLFRFCWTIWTGRGPRHQAFFFMPNRLLPMLWGHPEIKRLLVGTHPCNLPLCFVAR